MIKKSIFVAIFGVFIAPTAFAGWASIALNPNTGQWGESHGYYDLGDSQNAALWACGPGCYTVAWAEGQYIALATGPNGWGVSGGQPSAQAAVNQALYECSHVSYYCTWRVWTFGGYGLHRSETKTSAAP